MVDPVCIAVAENEPRVWVLSLVPSWAVVVLLAIEIATAALTATPPVDLAPVSAVVIIVSLEVALRERAPAPVNETLSASAARAVLLTRLRPSEAPMPAEVPVAPSVVDGMAETVELLSSSAVSVTAPVPPEVMVTVAPG